MLARFVHLICGLILFCFVAHAQKQPLGDSSPQPLPTPTPGQLPANCQKGSGVSWGNHGGELATGSDKNVVCWVSYYVCGKEYTKKSDPVENAPGVCDRFTESVKNSLPKEACCDCGDKGIRQGRDPFEPCRSSGNCKPDKAKGCSRDYDDAYAAFERIASRAAATNDFNDKAMQELKAALDPWIDTLRADFCDNSSARDSMDKLGADLKGLMSEKDMVKRHQLLHLIQERFHLLKFDVCGLLPGENP